MTTIQRAFLALFLLAAGSSTPTVAAKDGLRILFVGNSLTFANDLPRVVKSLLQEGGVAVDAVEACAEPNFGLEDHWADPNTRRKIENGKWDYVILQQGPSATEGRPSLIEYSQKFSDLIRRAGARPALYMVWPSLGRFQDFDGVSDSYRTAAKEAHAILLPVGEAWRAAWRKDQRLPLYGPDSFHPSTLGTYVAGVVIYQKLTGNNPVKLPATASFPKRGWNPEVVRLVQAAAAEANETFAGR